MDNHEVGKDTVNEDRLEWIKGGGVGKGEIEGRMILHRRKRLVGSEAGFARYPYPLIVRSLINLQLRSGCSGQRLIAVCSFKQGTSEVTGYV